MTKTSDLPIVSRVITSPMISGTPILPKPPERNPLLLPMGIPIAPATFGRKEVLTIFQGRIFPVCLHSLPSAQGVVTITIRNVGGLLDGNDVTDEFLVHKDERTQPIEPSHVVKWRLNPSLATSRIPSKRGLHRQDKEAVHLLCFSMLEPQHNTEPVSLVHRIPFIVVGRGTNKQVENVNTLEIGTIPACALFFFDSLVCILCSVAQFGARDSMAPHTFRLYRRG